LATTRAIGAGGSFLGGGADIIRFGAGKKSGQVIPRHVA
jgi:hypothetical protein